MVTIARQQPILPSFSCAAATTVQWKKDSGKREKFRRRPGSALSRLQQRSVQKIGDGP